MSTTESSDTDPKTIIDHPTQKSFGFVFGAVFGPAILSVIFYIVLTPVAVVMRMSGKDPLSLKRQPSKSTYWIKRTPPGPDAKSLKSQFFTGAKRERRSS